MAKKNDHLSYSQIEDGKCPHRYKLFRITKEFKKTGNVGLTKGLFVHVVVNHYVQYCVKNKIQGDFEVMEKMFKENFEKYKVPEELYSELHEQFLMFGEKDVNFDNVLDCEKHFRVEFDKGKFVEGYIDITRMYYFRGIGMKENEPILHILDYKNTPVILKAEETLTPQMRIYTLACKLLYPDYKYYRRGIYYTKYNYIRYYEDEDNPTPISEIEEEVELTKEMLIREWKKLKVQKDNKYSAKTGSHCYQYDGCPILLAGKCPKAKEVGDLKDIEDKIRKVFQMTVLVNKIKKEVKAYIKENQQNITVDEKEVGFKVKDEVDYPLAEVADLCKDINFDLNDYVFPKTTMSKILKAVEAKIERDDIDVALENMCSRYKTTSFKF